MENVNWPVFQAAATLLAARVAQSDGPVAVVQDHFRDVYAELLENAKAIEAEVQSDFRAKARPGHMDG